MFLEINDFLKAEEVARLRDLATRVTFVDGRISNPHNQAKKNLQASESDPLYAKSPKSWPTPLPVRPLPRLRVSRRVAPPCSPATRWA